MAEKYGIMNASTLVLAAKYDGATYLFKPGEVKEISNKWAARHLVDRWKHWGLVSLDYSDREAKKYGTFERFCLEMQKIGLEEAIAKQEETVGGFDTFDNECGDKPSSVRNKFKRKRQDEAKILDDMRAYRAKLDTVDITELEKKNLEEEMQRAQAELEAAKQKLVALGGNNSTKSAGRLQTGNARS